MYTIQTLVLALIILIWSKSPFGVLIYAFLAQNATNFTDWMVYTVILLVQQLAYEIIKSVSEA
jgi:hypothetical protein